MCVLFLTSFVSASVSRNAHRKRSADRALHFLARWSTIPNAGNIQCASCSGESMRSHGTGGATDSSMAFNLR